MTLENVFAAGPKFVTYEIHKLGRKGFLGTKTFWIIQLYSADDSNSSFERRGCSVGKMLVSALTAAQKDVKYNFMSIVDFQLAVDAMTE